MNSVSQLSLVGDDPLTLRLSEMITKFAPSRFPVLITGESGSGKEVAAQLIHQRSTRSRGPWVALNCAALPETLIESELFGHERGAFSGATSGRQGAFEQAHGGTLFLDELGELPLSMQAKLLRVLELGVLRRLGGNRDIQVDVRIVAATNRDLKHESERGLFRQDLYFRLAVCLLHVEPLRARPRDIVPLAQFFLQSVAPRLSLSSEAIAQLLQYHWPGNVRELRNVMYRASLLAENHMIFPEALGFAPSQEPVPTCLVRENGHLPAESTQPKPMYTEKHSKHYAREENAVFSEENKTQDDHGIQYLHGISLRDSERTLLLRELERSQWSRRKAAKSLGIALSTLKKKIKQYGLVLPEGGATEPIGS